ncbi:MAG TPA: cytochrome c3 family protein [candidate division Zixibacteria bacterium]
MNREYKKVFRTFRVVVIFLILLLLVSKPIWSEKTSLSPDLELTSTCMGCHEGTDTLLAQTPHRLILSADGRRVGNSPAGCTDCHLNVEKHLEEPGIGNVTNPSKTTPLENHQICTSCHSHPHSQDDPVTNIHSRNNVDCSTCHSIHHPKEKYLLVSSPNDLCLNCHQELGGKFFLVSHHPVIQKTILCIDCHKLSEPLDEPLSSSNVDMECFSCHAEYQGPFPYEHGAVNDYTVETEGCIYCHDPHGSPNPRLLKQSVGALCLNCHFVPKHQTAHGGIWAKRDCLECHKDIHGSYTDKNFFGEDLFGGSCFVYGCHVR